MITEATQYALKRATEDDYDFLYNLAGVTMRDYVDAIWGWDEAYQTNRFRDSFVADEWRIVLVDGVYAGAVGIRYGVTEIMLANIYILPEYQGRGIGSSVINRLVSEGRESGRPVVLNVLTSNPRAFRLYLRLGFHIVESTAEHRLMSTDK